jgi:hypothetical protein
MFAIRRCLRKKKRAKSGDVIRRDRAPLANHKLSWGAADPERSGFGDPLGRCFEAPFSRAEVVKLGYC